MEGFGFRMYIHIYIYITQSGMYRMTCKVHLACLGRFLVLGFGQGSGLTVSGLGCRA